jgi:hypothetical protein
LACAIFDSQRGNTLNQIAGLKSLLEKDGGTANSQRQKGQIKCENNLEAAEKVYSRPIEFRQLVHIDYARRAFFRVASEDLEGRNLISMILKKACANWSIVGYIDGVIAFQKNKIK